jgi:hypothetical protein
MSGSRSDADYQRYVDALRALGVEPGPGATADAIKRAHRVRVRECHPDYYPGDAEKAAEAQRVNHAKDVLDAMAKDGRLAQYNNKAERDRRTGGGDAPPPAMPTLVILVVLGVAGAGKTRGWAQTTAQAHARQPGVLGGALHILFACPTIALMEQTAAMLAAAGLAAPIVHMLHSRNTKGGVGPALDKLYPTLPANLDVLVMVTHAALFERPLTPHPGEWDLVIDEVPDTVQFIEIGGQVTHWHLTRHLDAFPLADTELYQLVPKDDDTFYRMGWIARIAVNQPYDGGLAHYQELARALLYGRTVLVRRDQWDELTAEWAQRIVRARTAYAGHLDALTLVPPIWFREYRSVTMMGARAMTHLTTLIWQRLWQVEFRPDRRFDLPLRHSARQSRRTVVHYIYDEPVTRAFLATKAANGDSMFLATCDAVARFHARLRYKPFLWSAPQAGEDREHGVKDTFWAERGIDVRRVNAFDPKLRLPGRTHGLNHEIFQSTYNVALLSVVNFTPAQYDLLHRLTLTDAEIDKATMLDVAYQDALRCNLRLAGDDHAIHITVLDRPTADDLATMFEDVRILRYPDARVPVRRRKRGAGRPASGQPQQTSTQRSRAFRARRAAQRAQAAEQKRET